MSADRSSEAQQLIGSYRVRRRLGLGGMGEVYLATALGPEGVQRPVAIKLIRDLHQQNQRFVELFLEEAKVSFLLTHPNVIRTYEIGEVEGHYFLVMEYVDGTNLERLLAFFSRKLNQPLPVPFALYIGAQVARGLDYAHALNDQNGRHLKIVHRDVSPSNVLLSKDGLVKVTDFGLATSTLRRVESQAGQIKGKLAYMAPEQLEGRDVDPRADIYALGIVLFEMLGGQNPFGAPDEITVKRRFERTELPALASVAPHLTADVAAVVERCLACAPEERFPNARELGRQIDHCMRELGLSVSDYELAEFISRAQAEADGSPKAPHPFDRALGMELRKVGGEQGSAATFVRAPTEDSSVPDQALVETVSGEQRRPGAGRERRRWLLPVLLAGLAVSFGVGAVVITRSAGEGEGEGRGDRSLVVAAPKPKPDGEARGRVATAGPGSGASVQQAGDARSGREHGTLHIKPVPGGGKVFVAGLPRGTAPLSLAGLPTGRALEVRIEQVGREGYRQQVTLQPGQELTLEPRLSSSAAVPARRRATKHGTLSVNTEPWSIVHIDGVRVRSTPLVGYRLPVGRHRVRLVNPARGLGETRSVVIHENRETRLSVELERE